MDSKILVEKLNELKEVSILIFSRILPKESQKITINGNELISEYFSIDNTPNKFDIMSKNEFLTKLRDIHIEEWDDNYIDNEVLDGTSWKVEFIFADESTKSFGGCNAYPDNFYELIDLFGMNHHYEE